MNRTPVDPRVVEEAIAESGLSSVGRASIREIGSLVDSIEQRTGFRFLRMEMGIPGLPAAEIGLEAERKALRGDLASRYPSIQGLPEFKSQAAEFARAFLNLTIKPRCFLPSTGTTNGSFITFLVTGRMFEDRHTTLFLDPGFPVHKLQLRTLGLPLINEDVYDYRGEKLRDLLEPVLDQGQISALLYSNPNNPSWICFTERELAIIGELSVRYDFVVIEDLAYLDMDFRRESSGPGQPPFQPTVAHFTDNYVLLISSSKIFSYAGQRVGILAVSDYLFERRFPPLLAYFNNERFGHALIYGAAYAVSAGVNQASQRGLAALLEAATAGTYDFRKEVTIYAERAVQMKKIFLDNGFRLVYDRDENQPLADGFYFTVCYPGLSGEELIYELLPYGISAISLVNTGSRRLEGIRACVSQISEGDLPELTRRLSLFKKHHAVEVYD